MAITVDYCEDHDSGEHEYTETGGSATMNLICAYEDAFQLCQEAMGSTVASGSVIFYTPPMRHPRRNYLYCRNASFEPLGASTVVGGLSTWTKAKVKLDFRTLDRSEQDDPEQQNFIYITENQSAAVEGLTIDKAKWAWSDTNAPLDESQTSYQILMPSINLTYTINNWPNAPIPEGTLSTFLGKINKYDFRALWQTWPANTLMFTNYNASRAWTSEGVTAWQVALNFAFKPNTWLKQFREDDAAWITVKNIGVGTKRLYEEVDFEEMFP